MVYSTVRLNTFDNKRAQLKCKILTGTNILQGNRAVFNQYAVDPTCKLCLKSVTYIRVTGHFIFQPYRYVVACVT